MSKADQLHKDINSFKEKVKADALELVLKKFPKKVLELNALSKSEKFSPNAELSKFDLNIPVPDAPYSTNDKISGEGFSESEKLQIFSKQNCSEHGIKIKDLLYRPNLYPMGLVQSNRHLVEMINTLKPQIHELIRDITLLQTGILFMIPKIEDGNNFGVEIQHETIETMTAIENEIRERLNCFTGYYAMRGDLIANVSEYPHSEDFRRTVQEHDEKFHLSLCQTVIRVRDHYASLHDLVTKNLSKLKKPRSGNNKEMLY
jgi:hypothetical protein